MREHRFSDPLALAQALAERVAADLTAAVIERGTASLVVSGGSTPRPFFERLRRLAIPWRRVWITLADERWVAVSDEASNEALVRRYLMRGPASEARFIGLKTEDPSPEAGQAACEKALREIPCPFDVVVLGMGNDGHTASLFPGAAELAEGLDRESPHLAIPVHSPAAAHPRMSLTLAALCNSRRVFLHITGDEKERIYRRALAEGPVEELPIRAVLRAAADRVEVYWAEG